MNIFNSPLVIILSWSANCKNLIGFNVSLLTGDLSSFDVDFFNKFNVVVVSCCSLTTKVLYYYSLVNRNLYLGGLNSYFSQHLFQRSVNEKCRKLSKRVAFYTVDCRDSCGEIFVDLQNYTYSKVLFQFPLLLLFCFLFMGLILAFLIHPSYWCYWVHGGLIY